MSGVLDKNSIPASNNLSAAQSSSGAANMDDFRALVKTFEQLDDPVRRDVSNTACLSLARAIFDTIITNKIKVFITDLLHPASFEHAGTPLGLKQATLKQSLERILLKASRFQDTREGHTAPFSPRLAAISVVAEPMRAPSRARPPTPAWPTPASNVGGNNIFHANHTPIPTAPGYPSPATPQLEQILTWGGESAVRGLLRLDQPEPTDMWEQRSFFIQSVGETETEMARWEAASSYGGLWQAPKWAGKGEPMKEYGGSDRSTEDDVLYL